ISISTTDISPISCSTSSEARGAAIPTHTTLPHPPLKTPSQCLPCPSACHRHNEISGQQRRPSSAIKYQPDSPQTRRAGHHCPPSRTSYTSPSRMPSPCPSLARATCSSTSPSVPIHTSRLAIRLLTPAATASQTEQAGPLAPSTPVVPSNDQSEPTPTASQAQTPHAQHTAANAQAPPQKARYPPHSLSPQPRCSSVLQTHRRPLHPSHTSPRSRP